MAPYPRESFQAEDKRPEGKGAEVKVAEANGAKLTGERRALLQGLEALERGGEPPLVTKWTAPQETALEGVKAGHGDAPITFVLSTDEVDRHGDVVSADGWKLDSYRKNPVLLWAHDYRHPAIGRATEVWAEPHRLLAKMEFAPGGFAQEVAALYRAGFQLGVSVGFKPLRFEERRDEKTGSFLGVRFIEQELLEVSAVPVPANRNALRRALGGPSDGLAAKAPAGFDEVRHLWPVLAAQADELVKLADELAQTVSDMEPDITGRTFHGARASIDDLVGILRSAKS